MMRSNQKFVPVAEDFNSPLFRNWLFVKGISDYPKALNIDGPTMAIFSQANKISYLAKMETWQKAHSDLKSLTEKNYHFIEDLIDKANRHGERLNAWTEKNVFAADLAKASNKKLLGLYERFTSLASLEYTYGVCLPLMDFQGFSLVENSIKKYLKSRLPEDKFQEYFSVFTQPENNSFSQNQEESLLRVMSKYHAKSAWRKDVQRLEYETIKLKYPGFSKALAKHARRFAWVYYVYQGPAFTECDFLDFIKNSLRRKIHPAKKLARMKLRKQKIKKMKTLCLKRLRPDAFNKSMLMLAGKLVWAKPRRKDYQSRSYYHIEKLHAEMAKRLALTLEQVRSLPLAILQPAMASGKIIDKTANDLFKKHICVRVADGKVRVLSGKQADVFAERNFKGTDERMPAGKSAKQLFGQTAFAGKARGVARIINRPQDMQKMSNGDILVSVATSPSIVAAMRKAAAIVTDEGGLTCHASIVSRELEIPCVVGLKIATKVFKDGDRVEVDAGKGVVRKLK